MRPESHPARRPTRYHWAAGLSPWHWVPALGGWLANFMLGATAAAMPDLRVALGAVIPFILLATLAWSGYWLLVMPFMPRFRRAVDAKLTAQYEGDYDYQRDELARAVHPDMQGHVTDVSELRNRARAMLQDKFGETDPFARDNLAKLDRLAISYLQMLAALTEYDNYASLVDPASIERDLAAARQQAAEASATLADAGAKQVELLENRLERYRKAREMMQLISAQMKNVETTMKLLVDTAMTARDPQGVGRDIDLVLRNIKDSEVLAAELSEYDRLEGELEGRLTQRL